MRTISVAGDIIGVPDDADDAALDRIAKSHMLGKAQGAAKDEMAALPAGYRAMAGFTNTFAEPVAGAAQWAGQKLGMETGPLDRRIAEMRGAREGAGTAGTVGELGAWAIPGAATERVLAAGAARVAPHVARALPRATAALGRAMNPRTAATVANVGSRVGLAAPLGAAEMAAYEGSRGVLPGDPTRGERAATGAQIGAVAGPLGEGVGSVAPAVARKFMPNDAAQRLMDWAAEHGVEKLGLTPGQAGGVGSFRAGLEETLSALPGVRQLIDRRRGGAVNNWNKAQLQSAAGGIQPTNQSVGEAGPKGVEYVQNLVRDAYDTATQGVRIEVPADINPFDYAPSKLADGRTALSSVHMIEQLPPAEAQIAQKHLDNLLAAVRSGKLEGKAITEYRSNLANIASQHFRRGDYQIGEVLDQLDDDFSALSRNFMSERQREVLDQANLAYRRLKPINRASAMQGAVTNEGRFTPSQLVNATRRGQPDSVIARQGNEQLQESVLANRVLGNTLPKPGPGTAEKLIASTLLGGGGVAAADYMTGGDPVGLLGPGIGAGAALGLASLSPATARTVARAEALRGPTRVAAERLAMQKREAEERRRRGY